MDDDDARQETATTDLSSVPKENEVDSMPNERRLSDGQLSTSGLSARSWSGVGDPDDTAKLSEAGEVEASSSEVQQNAKARAPSDDTAKLSEAGEVEASSSEVQQNAKARAPSDDTAKLSEAGEVETSSAEVQQNAKDARSLIKGDQKLLPGIKASVNLAKKHEKKKLTFGSGVGGVKAPEGTVKEEATDAAKEDSEAEEAVKAEEAAKAGKGAPDFEGSADAAGDESAGELWKVYRRSLQKAPSLSSQLPAGSPSKLSSPRSQLRSENVSQASPHKQKPGEGVLSSERERVWERLISPRPRHPSVADADCTFKPVITEKSRSLAASHSNRHLAYAADFEKKHALVLQKQQEVLEEELSHCTFKPDMPGLAQYEHVSSRFLQSTKSRDSKVSPGKESKEDRTESGSPNRGWKDNFTKLSSPPWEKQGGSSEKDAASASPPRSPRSPRSPRTPTPLDQSPAVSKRSIKLRGKLDTGLYKESKDPRDASTTSVPLSHTSSRRTVSGKLLEEDKAKGEFEKLVLELHEQLRAINLSGRPAKKLI